MPVVLPATKAIRWTMMRLIRFTAEIVDALLKCWRIVPVSGTTIMSGDIMFKVIYLYRYIWHCSAELCAC